MRKSKKELYGSIVECYLSGKSTLEMANIFNLSHQRISQILKMLGVCIRPRSYYKKQFNIESITVDIKRLRDDGYRTPAILTYLGVRKQSDEYDEIKRMCNAYPRYGNINYRKCHTCGFVGDISNFYICGRSQRCKRCHGAYQKKYRDSQPEEVKLARLNTFLGYLKEKDSK